MWPYFAFAICIGIFAVSGNSRKVHPFAWLLSFIVLVVFVGLRHRVGVDWNNYLYMIFRVTEAGDLFDQVLVAEPLYAILLIWADWTGFGMYAANLVGALFYAAALWRYARLTPFPWVAVMAAIPIFTIVVSMSANRQAMAAAVLMWLIAGWPQYTLVKRTVFVFVAVGFHYSALVFLAFVGWEIKAPLWVKGIALGVFGVIIFYILDITGRADAYIDLYVDSGDAPVIVSQGALQHTALNAIPASLYFFFPKERRLLFPTSLHRHMAFAALASVPLVFVASTVAGRISIFWYPVSIWVWSALPMLFVPRSRQFVRLAITGLMVAILAVWLLFSNSSYAYIPYQNALFLNSWELDIGRTRW